MTASFDIFDTALIRRCGHPENVWRMMAKRLWPDDDAMQRAFVILRRHANVTAGPTLADIYDSEGFSALSPYTPESLAAAEMAEESNQLMANPAVAAMIERHRSAGDTIAFVSDMYLPSSMLCDVLVREGMMKSGDSLFVSCEVGARKDARGALFKKAFGQEVKKVTHYGDNIHSDVKMARRAGAKVLLIRSGFTGTENRVMDAATDSRAGWELSLLAGASRAARLSRRDSPEVRFAADFVAPAMVSYIAHVIDDARKRGVRRLYFINRDGWLLHRIAEALPHEGVELRYFYASRKSLLPAYLAEASKDDFIHIIDGQTLIGRRPDDVLAYLGLSCTELKTRFSLDVENVCIRTKAESDRWLDILFGDGPVHRALIESFARQTHLFKQYLLQEGFADGVSSAMVDVGWYGSSRLMLNAILSRLGLPEIFTYYFGARRDILSMSAGRYDAYVERVEFAPSVSATAVIEAYFCACPIESTASYRLDAAGQVIPVGNGKHPSPRVVEVAETNAAVCTEICHILSAQGMPRQALLYRWMHISLSSLFSLAEADVDILPLVSLGSYDERKIARRLSVWELAKMTLTGAHDLTGFDKASMALSMPRRLAGWMWRLHRRTFALRAKAYMFLRDIRRP